MKRIRHTLLALLWLATHAGSRIKLAILGGLILAAPGCASVSYEAKSTVEILYRQGRVRVLADGHERCRVDGGRLVAPTVEP